MLVLHMEDRERDKRKPLEKNVIKSEEMAMSYDASCMRVLIWQISFPFGPSCAGLGFALSYTPAIAMVGKYFVERKALAYGIALSGRDPELVFLSFRPYFYILSTMPSFFFLSSSYAGCLYHFLQTVGAQPIFISSSGTGIGQFILAPVVQMLVELYSWRGALLIMGGFVSNLCVCGALMRPLQPRGTKR